MAAPSRYSTKIRAKRIALQYFKRLHPFRRWKLILSIAAPVLAALWLIAAATRGDQRLYLGGPVSTAHAMFESDCRLCHGPAPSGGAPVLLSSLAAAARKTPSGFFLTVSNAACTNCHAGPQHHVNETFTPRCATCHVEHLGRSVLVQIGDRHCVQCHGDLKTKKDTPASPFHATIPALGRHPEFAVTSRGGARVRLDAAPKPEDAAEIKLNHARHLRVNLKDIEKVADQPGVRKIGNDLQLGCTFCHRPEEQGQYLRPIAYQTHCAACHAPELETPVPDVVAPHDKPVIVHAFLRGTLAEEFERCQKIPADDSGAAIRQRCVDLKLAKAAAQPAAAADTPRGLRRGAAAEEPPPADTPRGRLGRSREPEAAAEAAAPERLCAPSGRAAEPEPAAEAPRGARMRGRSEEAPAAPAATPAPAKGWAVECLEASEAKLFADPGKSNGCLKCHTLTPQKAALPKVEATAIPPRWLPHARFDHGAHRTVGCAECHKAEASKETVDVLMPSIGTCRECHQPHGGARTGCVECHRYHDKTKERSPDGPFKVHQLAERIGARDTDRVR
jgi:hypothetical protein